MRQSADGLVTQFAKNVMAQNDAIMNGLGHRIGNIHAKRYIRCFDALCALGDHGKEKLSTLFVHEDPGVRSMAATFLLKYKTHEALHVLRELSKGEGLVAFGSQEAIKRWEEGTWDLEPKVPVR